MCNEIGKTTTFWGSYCANGEALTFGISQDIDVTRIIEVVSKCARLLTA